MDVPVCPRCGQEYLRRVRFRGSDRVYLWCGEDDALWESEQFRPEDYPHGLHDFETFLEEHDLRYPDDTYWIDLPFRVGQLIRSRDDPEAVGAIMGLADKDGRAYEVEFLDDRGHVTFSGRMKADMFYLAVYPIWEKRYVERRAKQSRSSA